MHISQRLPLEIGKKIALASGSIDTTACAEQVIVVSEAHAGITHEHELVAIAVIDYRRQIVRLSEVDGWHERHPTTA